MWIILINEEYKLRLVKDYDLITSFHKSAHLDSASLVLKLILPSFSSFFFYLKKVTKLYIPPMTNRT